MHKFYKLTLAITIITLITAPTPAQASDITPITSFEDLQKIGREAGYSLNGNYELTNDIDASASRNLTGGFTPIGGTFTGHFDGNGYKITGLYISRSGLSNVGLFSSVGEGGAISSLGVEGDSIIGNQAVGGLVGRLNGGTVTDCYFTGVVRGTRMTGGLVGTNNGGTITYSYSAGTVMGNYAEIGGLVGGSLSGDIIYSYSTANVIGMTSLGGLVGDFNSGKISGCYSAGDVNGSADAVGGLVGSSHGEVTDCYSTGRVMGMEPIGGLIGTSTGNITNCYSTGAIELIAIAPPQFMGGLVGQRWNNMGAITQSFWDYQTVGGYSTYINSFDDGRTTAEMYRQSTFVGWDFENVWRIDEENGYPYLAWQSGGVTSASRDRVSRGINKNSFAPAVTVRGKMLNVKTLSSTQNLQVRLIDMRGRTMTRFDMTGGGNMSLNKISAGRYIVDMRDMETGRRFSSPIVLR